MSKAIKQWRDQLLEDASDVFEIETKTPDPAASIDVKSLHTKTGELTLKSDFLSGALSNAVFSTQAIQNDPDLLLCRILLAGRTLDVFDYLLGRAAPFA